MPAADNGRDKTVQQRQEHDCNKHAEARSSEPGPQFKTYECDDTERNAADKVTRLAALVP